MERARVKLAAWDNHHAYTEGDVEWLVRMAGRADLLLVTEKDAVKLRHRWPADQPEPLVAILDVTWEAGEDAVRTALHAAVATIEAL